LGSSGTPDRKRKQKVVPLVPEIGSEPSQSPEIATVGVPQKEKDPKKSRENVRGGDQTYVGNRGRTLKILLDLGAEKGSPVVEASVRALTL